MKKTISLILTLSMLLGMFCGFAGNVFAEEETTEPEKPVLPPMLTYSDAVTDPETYAPQGTGTAEDPYLIATADDLLWVSRQHAYTTADQNITNHNSDDAKAANVNPFKGKYLLQTADIDLGGKVLPSIGLFNNCATKEVHVSTPGSQYSVFGGTYDGQGHAISNGYTSRVNPLKNELVLEAMVTSRGGFGLFGIIDGATIRNVNLKNFKLCTDNVQYISCTGLLVGIALDTATGNSEYNLIENCTTDADCAITYTGNTSRSVAANDLHIQARMGGLVGTAARTTIRNCTNNATITVGHSHMWIGGIAGTLIGGTIENCVNNGNINLVNCGTISPFKLDGSGKHRSFGGIVGAMPHQSIIDYSTLIDNCLNTGDITMDAPAASPYACGGILGSTRRTANLRLTVSNSANLGKIDTTPAEGVACVEGAIIGSLQVWSTDRVATPQTISVKLANLYSVAQDDLTVTEERLPGCVNDGEIKNESISVPMDDSTMPLITWTNLSRKEVTDSNGVLHENNPQEVVDACMSKEGICRFETVENIEKALGKVAESATPYRIQTYTEESGNSGAIRVIAQIQGMNAKKIRVELVRISDSSVAASASTTALYKSYLSGTSTLIEATEEGGEDRYETTYTTVKAADGSYFAILELSTENVTEGKYELRIYTEDTDGNETYRPSIRWFDFNRKGNLK